MTDHCINFLPYQVRAALDGRLSQTRRVLKYDKCGAPIMPVVEGDRLWVKEAWRASPAYDDLKPSDMGGDESIFYEADETWESWGWGNIGCISGGRYRHARFMPRWASRLTLTVTDVRVQRVQEISEDDAIAEGIELCSPAPFGLSGWRDYGNEDAPRQRYYGDPRDSFFSLWNSIHGPDAWDQNPWVAAISFDVHKCNIDQMEGAG